ncbi:saccharopine dehydrogenase family protein [Natrarchaeobius oligotrophus]|uniref:Saccharopine dehydrogenase n=1 Tax=Natrarchaeobius chitinivorans TaxID=1679083 RepID=A0A3N6N2Y8_NATCH|nr:saccharopine dehydrogenase NADP-binding domain-containing protein [Natrarchaeobius chitinivorans]RQH03252.1 saccharopine dehydrogenase [Natrarchaeobius chitinivorans]
MDSLLVYGSYGYTGRLIVSEAVSRGGSPVVAGRNGESVRRQAGALGLDSRTFDLESADLVDSLAEFDAVLNCAGPFVETAVPMVEACLEVEVDYLDVTGEFPVFQRLTGYDEAARDAGITLLPGVGFDVVPTDCLAAFLHEQLPSADRLVLAVSGSGTPSSGTARSLLEIAGDGGVVRRNGRLVEVPAAFRSREIDFGDGPEHAVTIPLGDVVTAAESTGIGSIEVYAAMPPWAARAMSAVDSLGRLLEASPVERAVSRLIDAVLDGPDDRERRESSIDVWGEVSESESDGRRVRATMRTPNPYALTAETAAVAAQRVVDRRSRDDRVPPGFQTPATAFGSEFALEFGGVERTVLETPDD